MKPEEAISILAQVINQTRALPNEIDTMREALEVLKGLIKEDSNGQ